MNLVVIFSFCPFYILAINQPFPFSDIPFLNLQPYSVSDLILSI